MGALVKGRSQSILHSEGLAFIMDFVLNGFWLVGLGGLQVVVAQQLILFGASPVQAQHIDTSSWLAWKGPTFLHGISIQQTLEVVRWPILSFIWEADYFVGGQLQSDGLVVW